MVFPKPVSAKTRARLSLARIISDMSDVYGSEVSGFELEIDPETKDTEIDVRARQKMYRGQFLKIFVSARQTEITNEVREADSDVGPFPSAATTDGVCAL